jgi:hypothetical protein
LVYDPKDKKKVTGFSWPKLDSIMCKKEREHDPIVKWERWQGVTYTRKDGSESDKKDFVTVRTPLSELLNEMASFFAKFVQHHECAKFQDEDWQGLKFKFPSGRCVSVQDFAENYTHVERQQHQSKYWNEAQSTVYPLVVRFHLDDLANVEPQEKEKLHKMFQEEGLPPIVTESHIFISSDMMHDTAFVHHVNDFLTEQYIKQHAPNVTIHYTRSDGCAGQYKNAHHFLWISKQKIKTLIQRIWSFFCSCHGKCDCDPEGGSIKCWCRLREMEHVADDPKKHTQMKTSHDMYLACQDNLMRPSRGLIEKKGRGIFRRFFYFVPAKGKSLQQPKWSGAADETTVEMAAVNRRIPRAETLKGTKKLHMVADAGLDNGAVDTRAHSCHQCDSCWAQNYNHCSNLEITGRVARQHVSAISGSVNVPLTRSALAKLGVEMSQSILPGAKSEVEASEGSGHAEQPVQQLQNVVAVEVDDINEPWMLGFPIQLAGQELVSHTAGKPVASSDNWMGRVDSSDQVLWVRKLMPTAAGSRVYQFTDEYFYCFVEDVRHTAIRMPQQQVRASARRQVPGASNLRWVLGSEDLSTIGAAMPIDEDEPSKTAQRSK